MLVSLGTILLMYFKYKSVENLAIYSQQYGYTESNLISNSTYCSDLNSNCGIKIYYKTDLTKEELISLINSSSAQLNFDSIADGRSLFTNLNLETKKTFEWNGIGVSLSDISPQVPNAYTWNLHHKGKEISITHYDLQSDPLYTIDGQPVNKNIIEIRQRIK